jgi:hypothetical protein
LYDGSLGGTPDTQGKLTYRASASASAQQIYADGATILDTTANQSDAAGYYGTPASVGALDRGSGYSLSFTVQLISESHEASDKDGDGVGDRAGFSLIVLSSDMKGIELGFWHDQVWAQADGAAEPPGGTLFTHAESAAFDTTSHLIAYTLAVLGDRYRLSSDGVAILEGELRDYTTFEGPINPYRTPNFIFLGDDTSSAKARIKLSYVAATTGR